LGNSDFAAASKMVRDMLQKANSGQMSDQDKQKLGQQLKDLSDQLNEMADEQKQMEDMLRREGMDGQSAKQCAGMTGQKLREALKQKGMTDEQIDRMMEKMQNARQACQNAKGLARSLAKCAGPKGELMPDGMRGLVEALDGMEASDMDGESLAEALKEIDRAIATLGDGAGEGAEGGGLDPNGAGIWVAGGDANSIDDGPGGGRARAWGNRPTGEPEDTGTKGVGVKNKPTKSEEVIASWLFRGPQAKGASKKKLGTVTRAVRDGAAEAISDKKIPRKYETPVKKYFGGLQRAAKDANQP
jgi:hypothetical protein